MHHVSELLVPGFGHPVLRRIELEGWLHMYVRDGYGIFRQPIFECRCCQMLVFRVCGVSKEDIGIKQQLCKIVRGKNFALNCLS